MTKYLIRGRNPLKGAVRIGGAKNSSFKLMIAALLAEGESRLLNISRIADVETTQKIIEELGAQVLKPGLGTIFINPHQLKKSTIAASFGQSSRAAVMFVGPLLARFGQVQTPFPGGDKIGQRPIDRHLEGLKALGVKVRVKRNQLLFEAPQLKGARYRFDKVTNGGTETMLLAAVKAKGTTVLENAALEPEIDDQISFLNQMGAKIKRLPGRIIKIEGVKRLKGTIYKAMPDRNEAVSYACAALATKGDIIIENARAADLKFFLKKVKEAGGNYQTDGFGIRFWADKPLKATKVVACPHPAFMTDWQPLWTTLMTQAQGESEVIEAVYEYRFAFVQELIKMGAKIKFFNPRVKDPDSFYNFNLTDGKPGQFHGLKISGPTTLKGTQTTITDIRAGATLVLAALAAQGESVLTDDGHIERGYDDLHLRLQELGAEIKRIA